MPTINIYFKDILRKPWIASITMLGWALYHTGILKIFCRKFFRHRICVVMCHGVSDDVKRQAEDKFHHECPKHETKYRQNISEYGNINMFFLCIDLNFFSYYSQPHLKVEVADVHRSNRFFSSHGLFTHA